MNIATVHMCFVTRWPRDREDLKVRQLSDLRSHIMSASQAYDREAQNDSRLDDLASKLSSLRQVTTDIHAQASDNSFVQASSEAFSNLTSSIRHSSSRLARSAGVSYPIYKSVFFILAAVLFIYLVWRLV
ncbi:hypothetical protein V1514DRAFT_351941 [Lipomyces japonicus]|uniref:uncharacterized protein n=1 Tax=Lipomyces japonicus TaxID=56871 RepID=UPI0034CF7785